MQLIIKSMEKLNGCGIINPKKKVLLYLLYTTPKLLGSMDNF